MYKNLLLMALAIPLMSSCDKLDELEDLAGDLADAALRCRDLPADEK